MHSLPFVHFFKDKPNDPDPEGMTSSPATGAQVALASRTIIGSLMVPTGK